MTFAFAFAPFKVGCSQLAFTLHPTSLSQPELGHPKHFLRTLQGIKGNHK